MLLNPPLLPYNIYWLKKTHRLTAPAVAKDTTMRVGIPSTHFLDAQPMGHPRVPTPPFSSHLRQGQHPALGDFKCPSGSWWEQLPRWFIQTLVSDRKLTSVLEMVELLLEGFYGSMQCVHVLQAEECSSIAIPKRCLLRRVIQLSGLETCW